MHAVTGEQRVVAGRYLLTSRIGRGAMGTVWRARDPVLARDVAVKEIQVPGLLTQQEREVLQRRTLREARAAARLNHSGVVTVFDVVEADGNPWIVMELVEARSLEQILSQDGPLPPSQAAEVCSMLLGALACAHAAGIMHRDVKPSNVLLGSEGRAVLTDFGIATLEGDPGLTQAGMVMGTPGFCAPERIRGEPAAPASDLWSLGATLYAAVEGHGPFAGRSTPIAVLAAVANEDAPPPRNAGPLTQLITALLQRDPALRPDVAAARRLLAAAAARQGAAPSPSAAPPAGRPVRIPQHAAAAELLSAPPAASPAVTPHAPAPAAPAPAAPAPAAPPLPASSLAASSLAAGPLAASATPAGPARARHSPASATTLPPEAAPAAAPPGRAPGAGGSRAGHREAPTPSSARGLAGPGRSPASPDRSSASPDRSSASQGRSPASPDRSSAGPARGPATLARASLNLATIQTPTGQHARPSTGGSQGKRAKPRPAWPTLAAAAAAVAAAGLLIGFLVTSAAHASRTPARAGVPAAAGRSGPAPVPSGYRLLSVPAPAAGATAGFRIAVPRSWRSHQAGLVTTIRPPAGPPTLTVSLAPFAAAGARAEAHLLQRHALLAGALLGYRAGTLQSLQVAGAPAVSWTSSWARPTSGRLIVREVVFSLPAGAGRQPCNVRVSAPMAGWPAAQAVLATVLRTFRVVP